MASGSPSPQVREWLDRLAPISEQARAQLREVPPAKLAMRTGCDLYPNGDYGLRFMGQDYRLSAGSFAVTRATTGQEPSSFTQGLILTYMVTADGTTPSGRWVGFRELPNGRFYVQAFQGYSGGRLVRELAPLSISLTESLRRAATPLGGRPLEIGDAGFAVSAFPRVGVAIAGWEGDDEFPSQASVLFEDTAASYMPTDGWAIVGSQLVDQVLKAVRASG